MTTAPNGELRRQDLHLQVQQLVSLRSLLPGRAGAGGASPAPPPGVMCAGLCGRTGGGLAGDHAVGGPGGAAWRLSRPPGEKIF
jgi:hypothetical protein